MLLAAAVTSAALKNDMSTELVSMREYVYVFVHCTMNTTKHTFEGTVLTDSILVAAAKEIPREHDRKNKMRLLANKNDIKIVSATTVAVYTEINNEMASISR